MKPNESTMFLDLSDINKYSDKNIFFCSAVVFSPETENNHFEGCPAYLTICNKNNMDNYYFKIPEIIAYYAKTHPCYTMQGKENDKKQGELNLANKIKELLHIL